MAAVFFWRNNYEKISTVSTAFLRALGFVFIVTGANLYAKQVGSIFTAQTSAQSLFERSNDSKRPKTQAQQSIVQPALQSQVQLGESEWTVLVYIQAKNNLESFAHKNLNDMAITGSNKNLTLLVQWYQPGQQGVWRYRIEKGKMILDSSIPGDTDGNKEHDLVDAVRWAHQKYPSKKFALILWNHGLGVVDPIWGNHRPPVMLPTYQLVDSKIIAQSPRIQIEGLTVDASEIEKLSTNDLIKTQAMLDEYHEIVDDWKAEDDEFDRSILFNEQSKTYMDNQTLERALAKIKEVRGGKKIDLLGMDACLMAMIEICHLARGYVDYFVGSQEVELGSGWDYFELCKIIANTPMSPADLAQVIVKIYENFYKNKIQFYTQSAIDLNKIDELKNSIDAMVNALNKCPSADQLYVDDCVRKARRSCLQFSAHSYIDLYSFCNELANNLDNKKSKSKTITDIKKTITTVMQSVKNAVIANTSGRNLSDAHGLSIYFPINHIDSSYPKTTFAQESVWTGLIKSMM